MSDFTTLKDPPELTALLEQARDWWSGSTEEEKEAMREAQRRSTRAAILQEIEDRAKGLGTI